MSPVRVFITGLGAVSAAGVGLPTLRQALQDNQPRFAKLSLFEPGADGPLPVGQVPIAITDPDLPRTHALALAAAREALGSLNPPEALVLGGTTGGIPLSEALLLAGERDPARYRLHGTGSVAEWLAAELGCRGPALTISTACSSSAVALVVALRLLRSGRYVRVLAGGVDGLCRLTYFGFSLLQLVDPRGARPLDQDRAGLTVAEGAAFLLLEAAEEPPAGALGRLAGGGMSCDAHHPTAPHPEGRGALEAMRAALADAGLEPGQIDYLNLHGTGTRDNDAAEARAVLALFERPPPLSSTKGIIGHSLAAAGALEAAICLEAIGAGLLPANAGVENPDPELGLAPVLTPRAALVRAALSNSFGFGGNNAALVLTGPDKNTTAPGPEPAVAGWLKVRAAACLTGAGDLELSHERLVGGGSCAGLLAADRLAAGLPARAVRRLKRLSRMALALGQAAAGEPGEREIAQVHFGTGFGPLSETRDFLTRLYESEQRLSSPTDFVGSVHNAPAGQLAIRHAARGPSVTATAADASFEQALFMAGLLAADRPGDLLVVGADEHHSELSPLFDPSVALAGQPADGGGALLLSTHPDEPGPRMRCSYLALADEPGPALAGLLAALGGPERIRARFAALLVGLPAARRPWVDDLLDGFVAACAYRGPSIFYRPLLGEFASASACACALASHWVRIGRLPERLIPGQPASLDGAGILALNLGRQLCAVEILP